MLLQRSGVVRRSGTVELDDVVGLLENVEVVELVLVHEPGGALEHVVVLVGQGATAAELGVKTAEERPLAGRPRAEVARAEEDLPVGDDLLSVTIRLSQADAPREST
ncbi:hypothetical protein [Curtobacterium sp. MCBD17_021]|uniref:hypothetical protein n=1 Tax=Curtobacterium sp. MCBD17_021 TaxID=2175665 RepID=UPI000DA6FF0B|nr:hypothetical protein [Curtobacterium sp. MCBD17_021]PZE62698.1 hypothetical protein DEI83_14915 [Curtobacterium sp. MCBD17_021]